MGNSTTLTSPFRIDTFGADVTISTSPINIRAMYFTALTSAKTVTFIDAAAAEVLQVEVASGTTFAVEPSHSLRFGNGLVFDDSASDFESGDFIAIFPA